MADALAIECTVLAAPAKAPTAFARFGIVGELNFPQNAALCFARDGFLADG
jgi:hypothetical protein